MKLCKALKACIGITIEEIAEKYPEYAQYIKQIATLRKYEQMRKEKEAMKVMKKSVGKHVAANNEKRQELDEISKETTNENNISDD